MDNNEAQFDYGMPVPKSFPVDDCLEQEQAKYAACKLHQRLTKACL